MQIEIIEAIDYTSSQVPSQLGTLYRPSAPQAPLAVILWVHGGAWLMGDRFGDSELCKTIAQAGFACFSIDYRLSQVAIFPAAIEDCKCAVRYLRAHAEQLNIQADKIGAWGPSAGGHLVALLGTSTDIPELEGKGGWEDYSSAVQAVCDWYGPTDFLQMSKFPCDFDHDAPDSPESKLIGGAIQDHPEKVAKANPITYLSAKTPPMFIAHGKQDRVVPFNQSELLVSALEKQGISVTFHPLENAGHGGAGFEADGDLVKRCIAFFQGELITKTVSY